MVVVSSTFSVPAEGVLYESPSIKLMVDEHELGTASLYITESNVMWGGGVTSTGAATPTISLLYPTISLHAIQREPCPALYMVLNYELRVPELLVLQAATQDDDDDYDVDDQPITQLRFIPPSENDLQAMYTAMSQGQSLHPDPIDQDDEEPYMDGEEFDEGDDEFEDAEESNPTPEEAASRLRQLRLENANGTHHIDDEAEDAEFGGE